MPISSTVTVLPIRSLNAAAMYWGTGSLGVAPPSQRATLLCLYAVVYPSRSASWLTRKASPL